MFSKLFCIFLLRFIERTHLGQVVPQDVHMRLISQTPCILCFTSTKNLLQVMFTSTRDLQSRSTLKVSIQQLYDKMLSFSMKLSHLCGFSNPLSFSTLSLCFCFSLLLPSVLFCSLFLPFSVPSFRSFQIYILCYLMPSSY